MHRTSFGTFGLRSYGWLPVTWCGSLYWLGRLQFNLLRLGEEWVCSTHIPRSGPLDPAEVDAAFRQAAEFFPAHFPDHPVADFWCGSWLLAPDLAAELSPESNIAHFQRRWRLDGQHVEADDDLLLFVFGRRGDVEIESLAAEHHAATGGGRPAPVRWALEHLVRPDPDARLGAVNTEIYLIRHGETEWSRSGQHTSVTDLALTERGEQQARALRGHLNPSGFGLVLSSPRRRALDTATLAGFTGAYAPQVDEDLVEWAYGDYEGRTSEEIGETDPGWTIWTGKVPGGETAEQVATRLDRVVDRVQESGVERAICFGHGHALRALMLRWLEFDVKLGVHFPMDTSTVSILGWEKGQPALERWNSRP